jgi:hypothetical protein
MKKQEEKKLNVQNKEKKTRKIKSFAKDLELYFPLLVIFKRFFFIFV